MTYDDSRNAVLRIAVPLQLLGHGDEDTGRQRHVEDSVLFLLSLFDLLQMPVEIDERIILIILTRDICAHLTEGVELLLHLLGGHLDVGLHPSQVFRVVHLGAGIADDLDILGKELVAILLHIVNGDSCSFRLPFHLPSQRVLGTMASLASAPNKT